MSYPRSHSPHEAVALPAPVQSARKKRDKIRHKQIAVLTQGEAVEYLLAEIEALENLLEIEDLIRPAPMAKLTNKEQEIFNLLLRHKDKIVPKKAIFERLYQLYNDKESPEPKVIDVYICKIRKKLRASTNYEIQNHYAQGVVLKEIASP